MLAAGLTIFNTRGQGMQGHGKVIRFLMKKIVIFQKIVQQKIFVIFNHVMFTDP